MLFRFFLFLIMRIQHFIYYTLLCFVLVGCGASKNNKKRWNQKTTSSTSYSDASGARGTVLKKRNNSLDDYADVLGVSKSSLKNKELYYFIDEWLGAPHKMGGLTKSGIDCSAFIAEVYKNIYDIQLPRTSRDMAEHIKKKYTKDLREGDLVFFSFGKRSIDHVGIYLHNNKFLHVSTKKGVIISDITDPWYGKYLERCGSFKK